MRLAPEGDRVVVILSGYSRQGLQVLDAATGRVLQDITQPAAFVGLAFSPDGRTLYASGGNQDVVYRYNWTNGRAALRDSIVLARKTTPRAAGTRYPAGLVVAPDGRTLYVAENLSDSLAVVDLASSAVVQRVPTGRYPYDVAVSDDRVYVSAWGGNEVTAFTSNGGRVQLRSHIAVARHPSTLLVDPSGSRLYATSGSTDHVAVLDLATEKVVARLEDPPPAGPGEGSTPNAVALSSDGRRLFVAEADANAIAVFDLATQKLEGRIPTGWYPTSLVQVGDAIVVASAKGARSRPNPLGPQPINSQVNRGSGPSHIMSRLTGGFLRVPLSETTGEALANYSRRVSAANGWNGSTSRAHAYPPFEHVIYVIKENRTYDQILGDHPRGDGDPSLMFFQKDSVSPNHHALADRFGLYDRFFVNAEVSADGHNWSTAAYASDYVEKTVQSNYSSRGRTYDYEGTNRGFGTANIPEDDVNEPASGYLWDLAWRKGVTLRNYGEFVQPEMRERNDPTPPKYRGVKRALLATSHPFYPNFNLNIRDQKRADIWIAELAEFSRTGRMPQLEIIRLPNDHTSGAAAGAPSPRAAFADNDLALGRMVEALSKSPYWKNTVMFVLEDDAQNGPDHVDAHRSPFFAISAYSRPGVNHRFANTTDVLRTIEEILGLESLSHFDYFGRPLRDIWTETPDLRPYPHRTPIQSLDEVNARAGAGSREMRGLDLSREDAIDDATFNRILWSMLKGPDVPYPGVRRASAKDLKLAP
jgi:YVTN family beta-propeller protein